jgi:hypothetical protein
MFILGICLSLLALGSDQGQEPRALAQRYACARGTREDRGSGERCRQPRPRGVNGSSPTNGRGSGSGWGSCRHWQGILLQQGQVTNELHKVVYGCTTTPGFLQSTPERSGGLGPVLGSEFRDGHKHLPFPAFRLVSESQCEYRPMHHRSHRLGLFYHVWEGVAIRSVQIRDMLIESIRQSLRGFGHDLQIPQYGVLDQSGGDGSCVASGAHIALDAFDALADAAARDWCSRRSPTTR